MQQTHSRIQSLLQDLPFPLGNQMRFLERESLNHSRLLQKSAQILSCPEKDIAAPAFVIELVRATLDIHSLIEEKSEDQKHNKFTILAGDFLFSTALQSIPPISLPAVKLALFEKIGDATRGHVLESLRSPDPWENLLLRSGSLYSLCFTVPALFVDLAPEDIAILESFGLQYGMVRALAENPSIGQPETHSLNPRENGRSPLDKEVAVLRSLSSRPSAVRELMEKTLDDLLFSPPFSLKKEIPHPIITD